MTARGDTAVSSVASPFPGSLQMSDNVKDEEEDSDNDGEDYSRPASRQNDAEDSPDAKDNDLVNMKIPTYTNKSRKRKHILTNFDDRFLDEATLEAQKKEKERLERLIKIEQNVPTTDHIDQVVALQPSHPLVDLTERESPEVIDISSSDDDIQELGTFKRTPLSFRSKWNIPEKERGSYKEMEKQQKIEEERIKRKEHLLKEVEKIDLTGGKLIVNKGHPHEDPDIAVANHLTHTLQPHQLGGICFMYNNVIESLNEFKRSPGLGCILAHSMGLGKTLQIVTFTEIFFRATKAHKVLIIVPINTIQNWLNEFDKWMPKFDESGNPIRNFNVFILGDAVKTYDQRVNLLEKWTKEGGALIIGYDMFRLLLRSTQPKKKTKPRMKINFVNGQKISQPKNDGPDMFDQGFTNGGRVKKEANDVIRQALLDPGPELVVCDEGHKIKNLNTDISLTLGSIKTTRRIVLTGYPLQNNLMEYYCMVDFVRPKYLGEKKTFAIMFEKPIKNGSCVDSTIADSKLAAQRTHVLVEKLKGFVQRRTHHLLKTILPTSREYVLLLKKSQLQRILYRSFILYAQSEIQAGNNVFNPLKAFAACSKIWNHPDVLFKTLEARREKRRSQAAEQKNSILNYFGRSDLDIADVDEDLIGGKPKGKKKANNLFQALMEEEIDIDLENGLKYDWAETAMGHYQAGQLEHGFKMKVAMEIINETIAIGEKVLLFSQNLTALDLMEQYLHREVDSSGRRRWSKSLTYFHGSTNGTERERLINRFNNEPAVSLFLISTRAGSLGINLVSANRCIILDACWNPCHDAQAVCRVYRYGQQKETFIYRLIMDNSMEKAIFNRQVSKHGLQQMVVDDAKVNANVTQRELETLLVYDEGLDAAPPVEDTSKWEIEDDLLRRVIDKHGNMFAAKPFLHESLIIERDEVLSEQEKLEAKVMYEREKNAENMMTASTSSGMGGTGGIGLSRLGSNSHFLMPGAFNQPPPMQATPLPYQLSYNNNNALMNNGGMYNSYNQMNMMQNQQQQQPQMHHSYSFPNMSHPNGMNNGGYQEYNNGFQNNFQRNNFNQNGNNYNQAGPNFYPPAQEQNFTFSDGTPAVAGLRFPGASRATRPDPMNGGTVQRIVLDRYISLPDISNYKIVSVQPGEEAILLNHGTVYLRLLNGITLDATGSIFDPAVSNSFASTAMPPSHLPLPNLRPEDLIELD